MLKKSIKLHVGNTATSCIRQGGTRASRITVLAGSAVFCFWLFACGFQLLACSVQHEAYGMQWGAPIIIKLSH